MEASFAASGVQPEHKVTKQLSIFPPTLMLPPELKFKEPGAVKDEEEES